MLMPAIQTGYADSAECKTLTEKVYRALRHDIVIGVHAPRARLRVEHLKERYGASAGTLREALALLLSDSLVVAEGQRGFSVAPISMDDFADITATRVLLECEALKQSIEHGDDVWASEVAASHYLLGVVEKQLGENGEASFDRWESRNAAFHAALIAACPSQWLRRFLAVLYRQSERYRRIALRRTPRSQDIRAEHAALAEAALARDGEAAAEILGAHIGATLEAVRRLPAALFDGQGGAPRARAARPRKPVGGRKKRARAV